MIWEQKKQDPLFMEAIEKLNNQLELMGSPAIDAKDLMDWVNGGESDSEIEDIAREIISEEQSVRAENHNAWRYTL